MTIAIYTDGSSRGNPGPGGWGAIIRAENTVTELGGREDHTTNNRMELTAAIEALRFLREKSSDAISASAAAITVQSDSKYVIQGITSWVAGWQRNGWITAGKKEVGNRDLWEALAAAAKGIAVSWKYVAGHAGHPGNERCDEIATKYADKEIVDLYSGPRGKYPVDLDAAPTPAMLSAAKSAKKKSSSAKAHSYLSMVDGVIEVHKTWAECEARVKGVRGAKFKKSLNFADEQAIIKEWRAL